MSYILSAKRKSHSETSIKYLRDVIDVVGKILWGLLNIFREIAVLSRQIVIGNQIGRSRQSHLINSMLKKFNFNLKDINNFEQMYNMLESTL